MSKEIKLSEEHLKELTDLKNNKDLLDTELLSISKLKLSIKKREENVGIFYNKIVETEKIIGQKMNVIYGDGVVDLPNKLSLIHI